ncbi:unnamed protein product [Sympodiomycopsis kandeliae]
MSHSPHARVDTSAISDKPHHLSSVTPPPGSPMPPAASLSPTSSTSAQQPSSSIEATTVVAPPPEVEATLNKLTSYKNVTGCLILSRPEILIIRSGGKDFDPSGPGAQERSEKLKKIVKLVKNTVETLSKSVDEIDNEDELGFVRVRTKKSEIMISPNDKYILVVLQDPTLSP